MIEIVRHIMDPQRGMEIMDVRDSHGRTQQFQCGVLPGHPEPEAYFEQCIAEFAAQEVQLKAHIEKRFDLKTMARKLSIVLLFLFAASGTRAAPTVTLTASSVNILGTGQSISITVILVDPNNTGVLKVSGTGVVPIMRASTVTPGTTATVGPIYGNDVILDAFGNANTTYYLVSIYPVIGGSISSTPALQQKYQFAGSGTTDLAVATPLGPGFVSTPGNVIVPGSLTVSGTLIPKNLDNVQIVDSTLSRGGSDIGAEINLAYASLPAGGGTIVVMPGPVGSCYSYSTPIVAATSGKYLLLEAWGASGATGLSTIAGCLNYTPTTATSAITLDYVPTAQSPLSSAHGLRNITLTNNGCVTSGGCGSLATGINTGTSNAGTYGATMDNVGISGFGVGYKNTNNLSVQVHWNNPQFFFNTVAAKTDLMTGFWIFGGQVAGNAVGMQASGASSGTEYLFYGTSFFANTGLEFDLTPSSATGSLGCFGCHFEKGTGSANARFINGPLNILLSGGVMEQDKTTGTDDWMINASGSFLDVEGTLFLASDTVTTAIVANSPVRGKFNGSMISQGHFTNRVTGANAANISDCSLAGSALGHTPTPCSFEAPIQFSAQTADPSGVAGATIAWYNGNTGLFKSNINNAGAFRMTQTIDNGTAAMTTAGILTGACGTTVTVVSANVLTTDVIDTTRNVAATIGNGGGLTLNAWPTAGNVNFNYCNSAAGTITPSAVTINWAVRR